MKESRPQSGFTLLELLLYISISSAILLVTTFFLQMIFESRIKNQTIAEVEQQGAQAMHIITQSIRNANIINSPAQGVSTSSLSINTYNVSSNPTIFDLSSGVLRITEGVGSPIALTSSRVSVSSLTFQNLSLASTPGTIRIQFTINHTNQSGRNEYSFSKTFVSSATLR